MLPDGINYVAGSASLTPTAVTFDAPGPGQTTLVWNLPHTMTTPGVSGTLTFRGVITTNYATGNRPPIVALDGLSNQVSISGSWRSAVSPTLTGLTSDNATAGVTTRSPQIDKKVKNGAGIFVDNPISATVGDLLDFRLVYSAPLNMDAKDNYLADFLPRGMSFVSQTSCGFVGTISNTFTFSDTFTGADQDNDPCTYQQFTLAGLNALRWNFGFVPTNFAMEVVIRARVDNVPEVADGVIVANFLKLSGLSTQGTVYSLRDDVVVNYVEPHLNLLKGVIPITPVAGGDTVTYTIQITNAGTYTAFNNIITDTIPAWVKVNLGSCAGSPTPASCVVQSGSPTLGDGGVISWTVLPAIGPAAGQWLTYTASISPGVTTGAFLTNTATVGYNSKPDNTGRVYSGTTNIADDNTDDAVVLIAAPQITKAAAPDPVTVGDVVTYTLTCDRAARRAHAVRAASPTRWRRMVCATTASATQTVAGAPAAPIQITTSTVITNSPAPGMTLGWPLGNIDNSNSTTQPYVFRVIFSATVTGLNDAGTGWVLFPPGANDKASDSALLAWSNPAGPQSATSNTTTTNIDQPLLRTTKSANRTTNVFGGEIITYTIRVTNTGYSPAYNLVLTDVVPAGISFAAPVSYTADAGRRRPARAAC